MICKQLIIKPIQTLVQTKPLIGLQLKRIKLFPNHLQGILQQEIGSMARFQSKFQDLNARLTKLDNRQKDGYHQSKKPELFCNPAKYNVQKTLTDLHLSPTTSKHIT